MAYFGGAITREYGKSAGRIGSARVLKIPVSTPRKNISLMILAGFTFVSSPALLSYGVLFACSLFAL